MKVLDPTYLRYVYDGVQSGTISSENSSILPDGLVGVYEEALNNSTSVKERSKLLDFFSVWALLKKEVSISFIVPLLSDWTEEQLFEKISSYSKWFSSPISGKYQLYHERINLFYLSRMNNNTFQSINNKIIERCHTSIVSKSNDEWENYALEHLAYHIFMFSTLYDKTQINELFNFSFNTDIWTRQIEVSEGFVWSKRMLDYALIYANHFQKNKVVEVGIKKLELNKHKTVFFDEMISYLIDDEFDKFINRFHKYDFEKFGEDVTFMFFSNLIVHLGKMYKESKIDLKYLKEINNRFLDTIYPIGTNDWSDFHINEIVLEVIYLYSSIGIDYEFLLQRSANPLLGVSSEFIQKSNFEEVKILYSVHYLKPETEWSDSNILRNIILCLSQFISDSDFENIINRIESSHKKIEVLIYLLENLNKNKKKNKILFKKIIPICLLLIKDESYYLSISRNNLKLNYSRLFKFLDEFQNKNVRDDLFFNLNNEIGIRLDSITDFALLYFYKKKIDHKDENLIQFENLINNLTDTEIRLQYKKIIEPFCDILNFHQSLYPKLVKNLFMIVYNRILSIKESNYRDKELCHYLIYLRTKISFNFPVKELIELSNKEIIKSSETLLEIYLYIIKSVKNTQKNYFIIKANYCLSNISDNVIKEFRRISFGNVLLKENQILLAKNLLNDFEENIAKKSFLGNLLTYFSFKNGNRTGITLFKSNLISTINLLPFPYSTDNKLGVDRFNLHLEVYRTVNFYKDNQVISKILHYWNENGLSNKENLETLRQYNTIDSHYNKMRSEFYYNQTTINDSYAYLMFQKIIQNIYKGDYSISEISFFINSIKNNTRQIYFIEEIYKILIETDNIKYLSDIYLIFGKKHCTFHLLYLINKFCKFQDYSKAKNIILNCFDNKWKKFALVLFNIISSNNVDTTILLIEKALDCLDENDDYYNLSLFYSFLINCNSDQYLTEKIQQEIILSTNEYISRLSKDYFELDNIFQFINDLIELELFEFAESVILNHLNDHEIDEYFFSLAVKKFKKEQIFIFNKYYYKINSVFYKRKYLKQIGEEQISKQIIRSSIYLFIFNKNDSNSIYFYQGLLNNLRLKDCTYDFVKTHLPMLNDESNIDILLQKYYLNQLCSHKTDYTNLPRYILEEFNKYQLNILFS